MNNLSLYTMQELASSAERRAKVLYARAERTLSTEARTKIIVQANAEQNTAVYWTMRVRGLTPQPMRVTA